MAPTRRAGFPHAVVRAFEEAERDGLIECDAARRWRVYSIVEPGAAGERDGTRGQTRAELASRGLHRQRPQQLARLSASARLPCSSCSNPARGAHERCSSAIPFEWSHSGERLRARATTCSLVQPPTPRPRAFATAQQHPPIRILVGYESADKRAPRRKRRRRNVAGMVERHRGTTFFASFIDSLRIVQRRIADRRRRLAVRPCFLAAVRFGGHLGIHVAHLVTAGSLGMSGE